MYVVIAYDVVDDGRRTRLAKALEGKIDRVQKSVFEGEVDGDALASLREAIGQTIHREVDSVRIYHLCAGCRAKTELIGTGTFVEPEEDRVV
jgi:CRISPR-associated protein Cas2